MVGLKRGVALAAAVALAVPLSAGSGAEASPSPEPPKRVLIVLFDQMVPGYANQFNMPNFRQVRDAGTNFKKAYLGYTASETVMAHNVITSGKLPKNMGWTDEAYRDTDNLLGKGADAMHITGDLSLADFGTLIDDKGYPKLADYLHDAYPGSKFIVVGQKSYAVESAVASSGDIAVRLSSRSTSTVAVPPEACRTTLGGRFRYPTGKAVPSYLAPTPGTDATSAEYCNRFYINSDSSNDYGTKLAWPSWVYPEDGNRFFPGTGPSSVGHEGGDTWVADASIAMMGQENWSGMFVTLGGIDKAGHMWGAQRDADTYAESCTVGTDAQVGAAQTHVRCAAENADVQFGKLLEAVAAKDASDGGETLVVLTADHGATYGENFYGKQTSGAGDSNWYWAPNGVWDAGVFVDASNPLYNTPSPALLPLDATNNLEFSYQSTEIETWLVDRSVPTMKEMAATMLTLPGVTVTYWRDGDRFVRYGQNSMTKSERKWWKKHGQELVDSMAASNGPDVVGLLHDKTSYGVYGDHGGTQESVQRVPMVFWSPSLAEGESSGAPFTTTDVMPTILRALGICQTSPTDGRAWSLDD